SISIKPENAYGLETRSYVHLMLGNYEQAQDDIRKALEIEPESGSALVIQGRIYERLQSNSKLKHTLKYQENRMSMGYIRMISPADLGDITWLANGGF